MKRTLIILFSLFLSVATFSQENASHRKGLTFKMGPRYLGWTNGFYPDQEDSDVNIIDPENQYGKSLRVYAGYFLLPKISLSLGFGLDRYEGYGTNTAPLVMQSNYYLTPNKNSFFASAEIGTQLTFSSDALDKGFVYAFALGKEVALSDKTGLNIYVGYNFQQSRFEHENKHPDIIYMDKLNRKSLMLGIDLVIF
ncbi:hypothetical protein [Marinilabilia salmonicolor]|uniref:hypothetical protein n=1 Tax=Marinilabilia salmonicolor TaxID=989 RepID=UPI00029B3F50|nr:hypothetical protein [Marinilabilia salmonicolor]